MSEQQLDLPDDFRDCITALHLHGVEFVLVGAHALGVHGIRELLANKRASGRPKDLDDVRRLETKVRRDGPAGGDARKPAGKRPR